MKTVILAALLLAPFAAFAADGGKTAPDKAKLRGALLLAHAKAFSLVEVLIGAEKAYSIACKDEKAFTTLMMIDMMISRSLETKKSIASDLAAASASAARDAAAHEAAVALVAELGALPSIVEKVMGPAKRCEAFMRDKDLAANKASTDDYGDSTWNAAKMHAGVNVRRLAGFDAAAELKAARALVEKTK